MPPKRTHPKELDEIETAATDIFGHIPRSRRQYAQPAFDSLFLALGRLRANTSAPKPKKTEKDTPAL